MWIGLGLASGTADSGWWYFNASIEDRVGDRVVGGASVADLDSSLIAVEWFTREGEIIRRSLN